MVFLARADCVRLGLCIVCVRKPLAWQKPRRVAQKTLCQRDIYIGYACVCLLYMRFVCVKC